MPFQKGHTINNGQPRPGSGRKGFEHEQKQLKKMKTLLTRLLNLHNKIYSGKATDKEIIRYGILEKFGLKVMDKLHASKQYTKLDLDEALTEVSITIKSNEKSKPTIDSSVCKELEGVPEQSTSNSDQRGGDWQ